MKKQIISLTMIAMLALAIVGCQTGAKGPSDEEMVQNAVNTYINGLVAKNLDTTMSVVSEDFSSSEATGKQGLRSYLGDAIDSGYLDDAEADFSDTQYTIEGDTATAAPITISSGMGTATLSLELQKADGNWLVTNMDVSM